MSRYLGLKRILRKFKTSIRDKEGFALSSIPAINAVREIRKRYIKLQLQLKQTLPNVLLSADLHLFGGTHVKLSF